MFYYNIWLKCFLNWEVKNNKITQTLLLHIFGNAASIKQKVWWHRTFCLIKAAWPNISKKGVFVILLCFTIVCDIFDLHSEFLGRLRLIRSVLRASKFFVLKLIETIIVWVYYTIPSDLSLFRHFCVSLFNFWNYFVWLRITGEGSVPEIHKWPILIIKSDLKWCIHLSRTLFLYLF